MVNALTLPFTSASPARSPRPPLLSRLPRPISHFLGYRPGPNAKPLLPFLKYVPLPLEVWLFGWVGAFVGIVFVEGIFAGSGALLSWGSPFIVASFGASAVLTFGAFEVPLAQPRNLVFGHFFSALVGVILTRLFKLNPAGYTVSTSAYAGEFSGGGHIVWFNGALSMATALTVMQMTGTVHPPAGATALIAAVSPEIVELSWKYLAVVLISSLALLGWGLIINNLGRRRYPIYWIAPTPPPSPSPAPAPTSSSSPASSEKAVAAAAAAQRDELVRLEDGEPATAAEELRKSRSRRGAGGEVGVVSVEDERRGIERAGGMQRREAEGEV